MWSWTCSLFKKIDSIIPTYLPKYKKIQLGNKVKFWSEFSSFAIFNKKKIIFFEFDFRFLEKYSSLNLLYSRDCVHEVMRISFRCCFFVRAHFLTLWFRSRVGIKFHRWCVSTWTFFLYFILELESRKPSFRTLNGSPTFGGHECGCSIFTNIPKFVFFNNFLNFLENFS